MKTPTLKPTQGGFNLIELLVVIAVIAILAAMLTPVSGGPRKARQIGCAYNLKTMDESFLAWAQSHDGKLPMQVSTNTGGTLELVPSGGTCVHFLALTNSGLKFERHDIVTRTKDGVNVQGINSYTNHGVEPRSLICPSDKRRDWLLAKSISEVTETNISYFVGIDATLNNPESILAGDRNLQVDNQPTKPGLLTLTKSSSVGWMNGLHFANTISGSGGNMLFADGHVEHLKPKQLDKAFQNQGLAMNRLAIP